KDSAPCGGVEGKPCGEVAPRPLRTAVRLSMNPTASIPPESGNTSAITVNLFGELRLLVFRDQSFRIGLECHPGDALSRSILDFSSVLWSYTSRRWLEPLDSMT